MYRLRVSHRDSACYSPVAISNAPIRGMSAPLSLSLLQGEPRRLLYQLQLQPFHHLAVRPSSAVAKDVALEAAVALAEAVLTRRLKERQRVMHGAGEGRRDRVEGLDAALPRRALQLLIQDHPDVEVLGKALLQAVIEH